LFGSAKRQEALLSENELDVADPSGGSTNKRE
jgi:hypothetical protein